MTVKKLKYISTITIFILCFLTHFLYDWFPCSLTAIFFPVNESIWEHMKMIYTTVLLNCLIEIIVIKKFKIPINNYALNLFITSIANIVIYLIIYLPIYYTKGASMFTTLLLLLISIGLTQILSYYILKSKKMKHQRVIGISLIIIAYIIFGYLTYHPIRNDLFFDKVKEKYGINIYDL